MIGEGEEGLEMFAVKSNDAVGVELIIADTKGEVEVEAEAEAEEEEEEEEEEDDDELGCEEEDEEGY